MRVRHAFAAALLALAGCASTETATPAAPAAPAAPAIAAFASPPLSAEALLGHIRVLSSDEFEGRAPGTHGEELTIAYIERAFAAAGLQPGVTLPDGTHSWVQETPLTSAMLTNTPTLTLTGRDGAHTYA